MFGFKKSKPEPADTFIATYQETMEWLAENQQARAEHERQIEEHNSKMEVVRARFQEDIARLGLVQAAFDKAEAEIASIKEEIAAYQTAREAKSVTA